MPRTFTGEQRRELARKGLAMPDGGYPIRNVRDLKNAIQAYGRGNNPEAVKKWIKKRAKELGAEEILPENWEIEHSDDELMHYGIKGMKWGVRRYQRKDGSLTSAGKNRYNENYTEKQRKQDRAMYGNRAERRINRRMNEGYGVKGARSIEAQRRQRNESIKKTAKRAGKAITGAAVSLGSAYVMDQIFNGGQNTRLVMNFADHTIRNGRVAVETFKNMYFRR